jgi:hypothetical protein
MSLEQVKKLVKKTLPTTFGLRFKFIEGKRVLNVLPHIKMDKGRAMSLFGN